jgi:hypothetical protein
VGPLKNSGNGRCLAATATGGAITEPCNGSKIQAWAQTSIASGFLLKNVATGRCLSSSSPNSVVTAICSASIASQRWMRASISATTARYRSNATGLFLQGTSSSTVITSTASNKSLQTWAYRVDPAGRMTPHPITPAGSRTAAEARSD